MVYAKDTETKIKAIADQHSLSVEQVQTLFNSEAERTGIKDLNNSIQWFTDHPDSLDNVLNAYNVDNPTAQIKPGAAKRNKIIVIAAVLLVVLGVGFMAYKKFKK
ncbi:MAG: hypothetical protein ACRYFZ_00975 [Janthinobacterium lividum]